MTHEDLLKAFARNGISAGAAGDDLLFAPQDITFGTETELQAAVRGQRDTVDLPLTIENSNYFFNIVKRIERGDAPRRLIHGLQRYLGGNTEGVWENSFVHFPRDCLSPVACEVFRHDLLADKEDGEKNLRSDAWEYTVHRGGVECLRVPVSYLLKLALADVIGSGPVPPGIVRRKGLSLMECFTNDNTSPETHSFRVNSTGKTGLAAAAARDMSRRFLLTQLLVAYANDRFRLRERDQEVFVYFSPHPPVRQRDLNGCISDAFYRELFMSPCLSGWARGEQKHAYMHLCHEVLSRSHLNAVVKLKEAGIITNELVVLPNTSNISLANNGTHLSQGSRKLVSLLKDPSSGFTGLHEKYLSDLVVKIVEHFLPLFVGTYSASPYRIDFKDFHPERVLGFLSHELDFTHLRMLWRRWRKKADIRVFKRSVTPFGPDWLDGPVSSLFRLRGDCIPDFRLIDYLVCLMSTERSPALNGMPGNSAALKKDLAELGVFHPSMSLYLFFKPREYDIMGFSGFEGRHYSLFEGFEHDFGRAALLQAFVTSLAFRYAIEGKITHRHIPDTPFVESERRQVIFNAAIGIPTFYVKTDTSNLFLRHIVMNTSGVRNSRRYPGYIRVPLKQYLEALVRTLKEDSGPLQETFDMPENLEDLLDRAKGNADGPVASRLTKTVAARAGARRALDLDSREFNLAAERYYRTDLRRKHLRESLAIFTYDLSKLDKGIAGHDAQVRAALQDIVPEGSALQYLTDIRKRLLEERLPAEETQRLIRLVILTEHAETVQEEKERETYDTTPVHRAGNA
jgi:hypothetical protein